MRENWTNDARNIKLSGEQVESLVRMAIPGATVDGFTYADGGLANTNICVRLSRAVQSVLLRLFVRDPAQARKESKLYELIDGKVAAPRVHFFSPDNPISGHPFLIREWIDGARLETRVGNLSEEDSISIGTAVGKALASIHAIKFAKAGFFNEALDIPEAIDLGADGLLAYSRSCLGDGIGRQRLGAKESDAVLAFLEFHATLLNRWKGQPCLSHSDFGSSNIIVRREPSGWQLAIIDWEFAFSGTPFFDIGNLLRPPLGIRQSFVDNFADAYLKSGGSLPDEWRRISLLTDLTAWFEFLSRPNIDERVVSDARTVIQSTMAAFSGRGAGVSRHHSRGSK